jgi:hypothetical protein
LPIIELKPETMAVQPSDVTVAQIAAPVFDPVSINSPSAVLFHIIMVRLSVFGQTLRPTL